MSLRILNEVIRVVVYLRAQGELSPWTKSHIAGAITVTFHQKFFYAAVNELFLAMVDPREVSPDNKYREEISALSPDEIISSIESFKNNLDEK